MQNKKTGRYLLRAMAALLVAVMVGGSYAYWTQELYVRNEFQLGNYQTDIKEEFEAPSNWLPGQEINKDAWVVNEGTLPVMVKAVVSQSWIRTQNVYDINGNIVKPAEGDAFSLTFDADKNGTQEYAAQITWGKDVVLLASGKSIVKSLQLGLPEVTSVAEAKGKWLLISETPDAQGNLTFYYIGTLEPDAQTPLLVDSVKMNPKIEATVLEEKLVYDKESESWKTLQTTNSTHSYECARYTLTITATTVQATSAAVQAMYTSDQATEQAVISYLTDLGFEPKDIAKTYDSSVKEKIMYFNEEKGTMTYSPVRNGDENWFMSFLNMVPGGTYSDDMVVENRSRNKYELYMQAIPLTQEKLKDELLELIYMKVYYDDELIYDGTALGKEYKDGYKNLQDVIFLGEYMPKDASKLHVELVVDPNIPAEYYDLLTQIDWKFTSIETEKNVGDADYTKPPGDPGNDDVDRPKTGDTNRLTWYVGLMATAMTLLLSCIFIMLRSRKKEEEPSQSA